MKDWSCNKSLYNLKLLNRRNNLCLVRCVASKQWLIDKNYNYYDNNRMFQEKNRQKTILRSSNIYFDCVHYEASREFRWNSDYK